MKSMSLSLSEREVHILRVAIESMPERLRSHPEVRSIIDKLDEGAFFAGHDVDAFRKMLHMAVGC